MAKVIISAETKADLREIYEYTEKKWEKSQAEKYLAQLEKRFKELSQSPKTGRLRPEIKKGCRSVVEGKHVVLYEATNNGVRINTVVHGSRDIKQKVEESKRRERGEENGKRHEQ